MKFWSKNDERQVTVSEIESSQDEIGTELSDDLMAQIAGGVGKEACHTEL